ncbi:Protein translocase subunit secA [Phytophthora cinnamomi]|uniref:Protein translocase subunit secA n=1 Tax=Phytophthora cinnamomi TaxID=4785 RepID=UPI00355971D1|nr:Protein translocase subunit secA [Phytophthora cinnamomi]
MSVGNYLMLHATTQERRNFENLMSCWTFHYDTVSTCTPASSAPFTLFCTSIRSARQSVWEATGSIGPQGLDGKAGAASRDGLSSPSFTATIQQWYSKGGWRGNHFSDPKIDVAAEPLAHEEQPKHIHATSSTEHGDDSINNTGLRLDFAQDKYQEQFEKLETKFRNCSFSNLAINWA